MWGGGRTVFPQGKQKGFQSSQAAKRLPHRSGKALGGCTAETLRRDPHPFLGKTLSSTLMKQEGSWQNPPLQQAFPSQGEAFRDRCAWGVGDGQPSRWGIQGGVWKPESPELAEKISLDRHWGVSDLVSSGADGTRALPVALEVSPQRVLRWALSGLAPFPLPVFLLRLV